METRYIVKSAFDRRCARALAEAMTRKLSLPMGPLTLLLLVIGYLLGTRGLDGPCVAAMVLALVSVAVVPVLSWVLPGRIERTCPRGRDEVVYAFMEEALEVTSGEEKTRVDYKALSRLAETKDCFLIYPRREEAYVLPKGRFTAGDPDGFMAFMELKTGMSGERFYGRRG